MNKKKQAEFLVDKVIDLSLANAVPINTELKGNFKIKGCIPGQKVLAREKRRKKGITELTFNELISPSDLEIRETCPQFAFCGGCQYLSLDYDEELKLKEDYLKKLFEGFNFIKLYPTRKTAYRNKMEYSFGDQEKNGPLKLGLHERNKYFNILETKGCQLVDEDFEKIRKAVQDYFSDLGASYFKKTTHRGLLRHLLIKKSSIGEILVALVTTSQEEFNKDKFKEMLLELNLQGEIKSINLITNNSVADAVIAEKIEVLYGNESIVENICNLDFKISPLSFFQVNSKGAELLYSKVKELIKDKKNLIFDLYAGTGTISQIVADKADQVIAIELNKEAVDRAQENIKLNGIENIKFICGDTLKVIEELDEKPELIILDPPRSGIVPKALKKIIEFSPEEIIYISCAPKKLREDLDEFIRNDYQVEELFSVDMFANTAHVETVAYLKKGNKNE